MQYLWGFLIAAVILILGAIRLSVLLFQADDQRNASIAACASLGVVSTLFLLVCGFLGNGSAAAIFAAAAVLVPIGVYFISFRYFGRRDPFPAIARGTPSKEAVWAADSDSKSRSENVSRRGLSRDAGKDPRKASGTDSGEAAGKDLRKEPTKDSGEAAGKAPGLVSNPMPVSESGNAPMPVPEPTPIVVFAPMPVPEQNSRALSDPQPEQIHEHVFELTAEDCLAYATAVSEEGAFNVAARLFLEAANLSRDVLEARKYLFNAMACYVKADMNDAAREVAKKIGRYADELSPIEILKVDAVLRRT